MNSNSNNGNNNGYMPPMDDGGDVVPSAAFDNNNNNNSNNTDPSSSSSVMGSSRVALAIERQDSMIDQLAVGLGRLREQSYAIGDEAGLHTQLLDEMETNMDSAHEVLGAEARRAARLRQEDGSIWKLQLIVAGLSISFVLLILMGHL
ncbi:hypothetical protein IV203_034359 [Nitzschia inconspicua]|uniref:t-SNARE coiled-coil homology domain-containing protein n=1 Tax=Nitzschia inconspicua TaxID=303405 RepID=A0A9K3K6P8_9STRA|nr:hypothetical protein IV203_022832 [Nitzschia inconspicua]KAG7373635.1 hypothetical protein IV203_034359 [Nitzschia inconspicua]